jgi:hypothetical protein
MERNLALLNLNWGLIFLLFGVAAILLSAYWKWKLKNPGKNFFSIQFGKVRRENEST